MKREKNPNWKGGKHISSHGYVKVNVGIGHHLADSKGYAYEHRLVAEQILGRKLQKGEIVHHIDGKKQNNEPENIYVVDSNGKHYFFHRKRKDLRAPGEANPLIECACGCGEVFRKYDKEGRPRKYLVGHSGSAYRPTMDALLKGLSEGKSSIDELGTATKISRGSIHTCLCKLAQRGEIIRIKPGIYTVIQKRSLNES